MELEDKESAVEEGDDFIEEAVSCLRIYDDSDVEDQFVLSVETCLPDDFVGLDRKEMHLN